MRNLTASFFSILQGKIIMNKIQFMNIQIDNVTLDEALHSIKKCIIENEKSYVVTPNVDHIVKLQTNKKFLKAYENANLVAVDGTPIMIAAKWYGTPLKEKITGPRLTEHVVKMASENHFSVFVLGAGIGVADQAAKNLLQKYPGFIYVGSYSPPYGFEKNTEEVNHIIEIINNSKAQIVIAGMGSPKTEIFLSEIYQRIDANISLSIGAAIDFFAGKVKRCPEWINKIGMEWFYRFLKNPGRMGKRYFIDDLTFFSLLLKYKRKVKK